MEDAARAGAGEDRRHGGAGVAGRGGRLFRLAAQAQPDRLDSRETFEARITAFEKKFEGDEVPRPPHWSGFRVAPELIEFWYGARFRLHERQHYQRVDGQWTKRMLYP